jgi:hypothetical protein
MRCVQPSPTSTDKNIKSLGLFIGTQNKNYEAKTQIMMDENIYNLWTQIYMTY